MRLHFHILLASATALHAASVSRRQDPQALGVVDQCCRKLGNALGAKVSLPDAPAYKQSIASYWSLQARLHPGCIVSPTSADDVKTAVTILAGNQCRFAVRGGGHTPQPGPANIDNGVTIDLGAMKQVSTTADTKTTSIGPGARWIDVYNYLDARGLAVPGGRAATVGVAGLTTGGGNSFFSARYGFVCDNVKEFEVVLGTGEIVTANAQTRPDLFKALKGGSNNLGIVTRFDLITFPQGKFWGGTKAYPNTPAILKKQIDYFGPFLDNIEKDQYGSLIQIFNYNSDKGTASIVNAYEYTDDKAGQRPFETIDAFKQYNSIEGAVESTMRVTNSSDLTTELSVGNKVDARDLFATLTFLNDPRLHADIIKLGEQLYQPFKKTKGLLWDLMFQPLPRIITEQSIKAGGNVLGLDRQKRNAVLFLFYLQWDDAADDAALYKAANDILDGITKLAQKYRASNDYVYLNYAFTGQHPIESYGPANVDLLRKASKAYDPTGVFQQLVPGGFKIPPSY